MTLMKEEGVAILPERISPVYEEEKKGEGLVDFANRNLASRLCSADLQDRVRSCMNPGVILGQMPT